MSSKWERRGVMAKITICLWLTSFCCFWCVLMLHFIVVAGCCCWAKTLRAPKSRLCNGSNASVIIITHTAHQRTANTKPRTRRGRQHQQQQTYKTARRQVTTTGKNPSSLTKARSRNNEAVTSASQLAFHTTIYAEPIHPGRPNYTEPLAARQVQNLPGDLPASSPPRRNINVVEYPSAARGSLNYACRQRQAEAGGRLSYWNRILWMLGNPWNNLSSPGVEIVRENKLSQILRA